MIVGISVPGVENHAIGALRGALREAELTEAFVAFQGFRDLEHTVAEVLSYRPRTVGISLPTVESALATATFTRLLRRRGFNGRIVVGGHFATLNAEELLHSAAQIDAVVQFAGEEALVAIARGALDAEETARRVPGLVFRDRAGSLCRGAAPRWTSPSVLAGARRFEPLPEHLGFPAADLIASRGCEAHCSYCCIAAATDLARAGAEDGKSVYERRSLSSLAEEIASLHHEHGARVFNFMDDNVLPLDPEDASAWALELRDRLDAMEVSRIALSMQLRADVVTDSSASALARLGLVRAYVGVDGYSRSQLRALGRRAEAAAGGRSLRLLKDQGVFAVVNALLVGPTIPFESVLDEVEALGRLEHAPVHLLPIEVRAGTSYFRAAERRGLVEGGFLHWHYRFADERTARMGEMLMEFPTRLTERSVPIALYDLGYNLGIARRLIPDLDVVRHARTYARVTEAWNARQTALLSAAAAVAWTRDRALAAEFVQEHLPAVTATDRRWIEDCDRALADIERSVALFQRRPVSAHARGKLLGAVAFSMSIAACGGDVDDGGSRDATRSSDASIHSGGSTSGGGTGSGGSSAVGGANASGGTGPDAAAGGGSGLTDGSASACLGEPLPFGDEYNLPGFCPCQSGGPALVTFDETGRAVAFAMGDGGAIPQDLRECLASVLAAYCYPSLAGTTQTFRSHCWIA